MERVYDPTQELSITFFKTVQNKMHWAITGKTAAETIRERADATKPDMGMISHRNTVIRKPEVSVAKNYLNIDELAALNNLAEQYLIFAEGQALRRIPMYMNDWVAKLDGFLSLNDREILTHAGKMSHELTKRHAEQEYEKFRVEQARELESDFDRLSKTALVQRKVKIEKRKKTE